MSAQIKFTGKSRVWITDPNYYSVDELVQLVKDGGFDRAVNYTTQSNVDMTDSGWVEIGTCEITVTLHDTSDITAKQVEALQAELTKFRADAHMHEQALLARISKLQALPFNSVETA